MDKYWKLIDFCDKREVIDCESEEECISLIHDIIHRTVPSEEWGDLEITSSKIRQNAHEYVCYSAMSDRYIRFFFYFYDANLEELDDELDHNRKLNAVACELSERSEINKLYDTEYYKEVLKSKEHRIDILEMEKQKLVREHTELEMEKQKLVREHIELEKELAKANRIIDSQRERIMDLQEILDNIRNAAFPF